MGQLYAAYARAIEVRMMSRIVGEADLSATDQSYLRFAEQFEQTFIAQGKAEERSIEKSLDLGWRCLGLLPPEELTRISIREIKNHATLMKQGATPGEA
jgi:V/A-type H+-transporting ATPase subunit B